MKNLIITIFMLALVACNTEKKEEKTEDHSEHQDEAKKADTKKKP